MYASSRSKVRLTERVHLVDQARFRTVPDGTAYVLGAGNGANKETIQLSSIRFQPIAEIAVAQDGVINVADQVSLRILALENYKPQ
uniref:Sema domain-containing protein n=1 Tax=Anopheles atroparvus TaxID=41427 RepID=A0A182J0I6_ANOAO